MTDDILRLSVELGPLNVTYDEILRPLNVSLKNHLMSSISLLFVVWGPLDAEINQDVKK